MSARPVPAVDAIELGLRRRFVTSLGLTLDEATAVARVAIRYLVHPDVTGQLTELVAQLNAVRLDAEIQKESGHG